MQYERTVAIQAPAARVWALLSDVAGWPDWTPTVTAVATEDGALAPGRTVTVTQPGRRPTAYTVEEFSAGSRFRWGRTSGGVRQWADHVVTAGPDEHCSVTLTFAMEGALGSVFGSLGAGKIRSMVDTEANSLKARAEAA